MNAVELLSDMGRLCIRLQARGGRLRYYPRSAVTPDLAERLKAHKPELLAILGHKADAPSIDPLDAAAVWNAALDRLEGDPIFSPDVMDALRAADVHWASDESPTEPSDDSEPESLGPDGWPMDSIDPNDFDPCPKCETLELWQTLAGNWRCQRCDPPTTARRLAERTERIRRRTKCAKDTRQNG